MRDFLSSSAGQGIVVAAGLAVGAWCVFKEGMSPGAAGALVMTLLAALQTKPVGQ